MNDLPDSSAPPCAGENPALVPTEPNAIEEPVSSRSPLAAATRVVDAGAQTLLGCALAGELGSVLANVAARTFFDTSFLWTDEIARLALSTLAFVGGSVAYRRRHHSFIAIVLNQMPPRLRQASLAIADILALLLAVLIGVASLDLVQSTWDDVTPILQLPGASFALPLTASMALLALYAVDHLWQVHRLRALALGIRIWDFSQREPQCATEPVRRWHD